MSSRQVCYHLWVIVLMLGLSACAGLATTGQKYVAERDFAGVDGMTIEAAVALADDVFSQQQIVATGRSAPSGYISGITYRGSGFNRISFTLMVDITRPGPERLRVKATSTAGPEVAFTTDLDDIAEDFVAGYARALGLLSDTRMPGHHPGR